MFGYYILQFRIGIVYVSILHKDSIRGNEGTIGILKKNSVNWSTEGIIVV